MVFAYCHFRFPQFACRKNHTHIQVRNYTSIKKIESDFLEEDRKKNQQENSSKKGA